VQRSGSRDRVAEIERAAQGYLQFDERVDAKGVGDPRRVATAVSHASRSSKARRRQAAIASQASG
jgi:hypothetical protein